jgi:TRAP-type transport system small permease protein
MKFGILLANAIHKFNRYVAFISVTMLLIMVFFVAVDVFGRYLFNHPILGGMEIQELMMVVIIFLALGITTYDKQHVYVELLVNRLKGRTQAIVNSFATLASFIFIALLIWQTAKSGISDLTSEASTITPSLSIPVAPFIFVAALGLIFMALEFFVDLVINLKRFSSNGPKT